ncbi:hook-length control protein FliK [Nitrosospira sp. Nl5]|uniref:flagellar hook-length control protein FliK n=1 Tax=Nitrosospira sp. Nl5 TaxID=200120 RepID=UPI000881BB20|nr:flagellar hook-length control protein FliK [Nitrosospira sp. Nl5]SCY07533.1 hook-length control protein FliK [Nitrosospira sp. Nl5]
MFGLNALNALARVYPSLALTHRRPGEAQFLAGLEPGQHLRATVQANLAGDEFMVSLHLPQTGKENGQMLHMKLPASVRAGDLLNLVFISREPRPTFALMAGAPPAEASPLLSETGRFLDSLLRRPVFQGGSAMLQGAIPSHFPLLAAPPVDGVELAQSLGRAFGRSGLFYEAHQAQWISGAKPVIELLLEPQARLSGLPVPASAVLADFGAEPGATVPANNAGTGAYAPVHPDALPLVRQQLEVLETRHLAWQGMAWPGQPIVWEVDEEAPQLAKEQEAAGQPCGIWRTCLSLTLPNLGQVAARLRLGAGGVEVRVTVAEPAAAAVLRASAIPLANGMESAGIRLLGIGVELDEKA